MAAYGGRKITHSNCSLGKSSRSEAPGDPELQEHPDRQPGKAERYVSVLQTGQSTQDGAKKRAAWS